MYYLAFKTKALELSRCNRSALVERAACYLKIGKNDLALADAEDLLKDNKEFTKVFSLVYVIHFVLILHPLINQLF